MGIEDLNLDVGEHAEKILVIAETDTLAARIGAVLEQRAYQCRLSTGFESACDLAATELFDLVVAEVGSAVSALEAIHSVLGENRLRRSPILVLHPAADRLTEEQLKSLPAPVAVLQTPFEPSALLVRVTAELRLRKIRTNEIQFTSRLAEQNATLRDLTTRFKQELQEAQSIQASIMPKSLPSAPGASFAATYVPFEAVGGDLYDIWRIDKDLYGMFVGDVTGHGLPAAFIGAMTKMALSYAKSPTPDEVLAEMNAGLCPLMPEGRFVTAAAAFYSPSSGQLLVARGGHPPGYLYRAAEKTVQQIAPRGFPLGVLEMARYELYSTRLEPGDKFVLVTDGLTETINLSGEILGVEGTGNMFAQIAAENSIDACLGSLLEKQEEYAEGRIVKDDITLLGIERIAR